MNYFVFSGDYVAFPVNADDDEQVLDRINKYSTRVLQLSKQPSRLPVRDRDAFAGIEVSECDSFLKKLWTIGADPDRQVISGAGLCLSDGAILDLPPFSNMRQNVMWIDDHPKYALHHELRHLGYLKGTLAPLNDPIFDQLIGQVPSTYAENLASFVRIPKGRVEKQAAQAVKDWMWETARRRLAEVESYFEEYPSTVVGYFLSGRGPRLNRNDQQWLPENWQGGLKEAIPALALALRLGTERSCFFV